MPQLQPLVLKDRASTPVNHTFAPVNIVDGVGTVAESTGVPQGESVYTISLRKTAQGRRKVTLKLSVPISVTETINGVAYPKVVRTAYAEATFSFDPASTLQERKDIVGMFADSMAADKTLVNGTLVNLEGVY